jgi:hypothetical protein
MRRTLGLLGLLAVVSFSGACATDNSANNNNTAPKNGVVETNANLNKNMNDSSAPSNVGVLTNNNGNKNTSGIRTTDHAKSNQNGKPRNGNGNN